MAKGISGIVVVVLLIVLAIAAFVALKGGVLSLTKVKGGLDVTVAKSNENWAGGKYIATVKATVANHLGKPVTIDSVKVVVTLKDGTQVSASLSPSTTLSFVDNNTGTSITAAGLPQNLNNGDTGEITLQILSPDTNPAISVQVTVHGTTADGNTITSGDSTGLS